MLFDEAESFFTEEDGDETDEFDNDDPDAQTDKEVQTEHWNSERLSE